MNVFRKYYVELRYYLFKIILPFPKIISNEETLELLINTNKSLVRYGDGEFHILGESEDIGFQQLDKDLSRRLKEILISNNPNCAVALPIGLYSVRGFNAVGNYFWKQFVVFHYRKYINYLNFNKTYCSANVTRPYMDFIDHSKTLLYFDRMKDLWKDKKVLIVEGEMSRLGVGNDLFSKAKLIHRIVTLPQNAYQLYSELLNACTKIINNYDLVLISLGPTATVLTYDLCEFGVQVVDIGHIDLEYEWFLKGVTEKVEIEGKHVNELSYKVDFEESVNPLYLQQIIHKVFK